MIRRMQSCELLDVSETRDAIGERIRTYTATGTVQMAISTIAGKTDTINNVKTVNSTHLGVTKSRSITEQQRVRCGGITYRIDYVNIDNPRCALVYLEAVPDDG